MSLSWVKSAFGAIMIFWAVSLSAQETKFYFPLNTQNVEYNPIISPNGRYVIFQSNRPGGEGGMDLWLSENKNFPDRIKTPEWSPPINLREINTAGFEGMFSILFDPETERPKEIYLTSLRDTSTQRPGYLIRNCFLGGSR